MQTWLVCLALVPGLLLLVSCGGGAPTDAPPTVLETNLVPAESSLAPGAEPTAPGNTPTAIMLPTITPKPSPPAETQAGDAVPEAGSLPVAQPDAAAHNGSPVGWVFDLAFVDADYGWALGRSVDCGINRVCPVAISATADGGQTWRAIPAPTTYQAGSIAPGGVEHIHFANHSDGWVFGPSLFATHDGGLIWTEHQRMGEIIAVEAAGASVWAIERTCAASAPDECTLTLLVATIDEQDWQPAPVQPPLQDDGLQLIRTNEQRAWLLNAGWLYRTDNGGASWDEHLVPCGGTLPRMPQLAARDEQYLALLCTGSGSGATLPSLFYTSSDGGEQWQFVAEVALPLVAPQRTNQALNDFAMPAADRAFIAMVRSTLFGTSDGGATWDAAIAAEDAAAFAEGGGAWRVLFVDEQHGWAVTNIWDAERDLFEQDVYRTTDGGATWQVAARAPLG